MLSTTAPRPTSSRTAPSRRFWLLLLAVGALGLSYAAACVPNVPRTTTGREPGTGTVATGGSAQQPAPAKPAVLSTDLKITGTEFKFDPPTPRVPVGQKVAITFDNQGAIEHDVAAEGTDFHLVAKAGQVAKGEFTFSKPGTYQLVCTIPGHKEAGMKGTLTVVAAGAAQQPAVAPANQPLTLAAPAPTPRPLPVGLTALPPPEMALPISRTEPATVTLDIETREVTAQMADGVAYPYWTFNGTVPGPMLRVREGDTVELTLRNAADSKVTHSIDLHAVNGPGGGAKATQIPPGGMASFRFTALNPGVYVYHCATPMVAMHIASGMYGLIVVEPPEGFPRVDREFYLMQGDFYLQGARGEQGLRDFAMDKMLDERPDYVVFNGSTGALVGANALKARVGETVRIFFGVGGPNLVSSFHLIGEIFDRVYQEGAMSAPATNVQTTLVPAGGSTVVEFKVDVPGTYTLVDHSLGRLEKGGAGQIVVEGPENPDVFQVLQPSGGAAGGY